MTQKVEQPGGANGGKEPASSAARETATLGGGCFWCLEAVYLELVGVEKVVSGYAGGSQPNPTYQQVCSGRTGHAEVVQLTYDPAVLTYAELLELFFSIHDPTTLNRQGNDVGSQYRSVIFYHDEEQKGIAQETIARLEAAREWSSPIVTEVAPLDRFFEAEAYHQEYYRLNGEQPYCRIVISPKMAKFRKQYANRLKQ